MAGISLKLINMLLSEALCPATLQRRPEPSAGMDDLRNVEAFHEQGDLTGPLVPVYHFNALVSSRMVGEGGTIVDLGSGSGQYLAFLANRRPDIRIIGFDLSETMVEVGSRFLADVGLGDRVQLNVGNMTQFRHELRNIDRVDLISSVFSLHHLPTLDDLKNCLNEIRLVKRKFGCAVWIFDHARPRHPRTPEVFPEIFTPQAPKIFRNDSCNSLIASYSFAELCRYLDEADIESMEHRCARWMRLYQVHWAPSRQPANSMAAASWVPVNLTKDAYRDYEGLRFLFPDVPLDSAGS